MAIDQQARESVATAVKVAMVRSGITQHQIAEALGVSQPAVSARLAGRTPWTVDELTIVARLLDVRPSVLLGDAA